MSHLGSSDTSKGEKTHTYTNNHPKNYASNNQERFSARTYNEGPERPSSKELEDLKNRRKLEQLGTLNNDHNKYQARESMNPATSHPVTSAGYPRTAGASPQSRSSGPPSHLESYGLPSHVSSNPSSTSGHHHSPPVHSYRHLLPPHGMIPGQFGNSTGAPPIGMDVMWQQKMNPANPWILAHYEEMRMERERTMAHERERSLAHERERAIAHERERSIAHERERTIALERERAVSQERERTLIHDRERTHERERTINHERERERERLERQKDDRVEKERQREWQDQERQDREQAQREAVRQHFEESLRLVLQKQKNIGWNPISNSKNFGKGSEGSMPNIPPLRNEERSRDSEKERAYAENNARREHERWLAMVQQQRNEQTTNASLQNYSSIESRSARSTKAEPPQLSLQTSKANLTASPVSSSASQMKNETNFSLYGYQPFQHTYITHAQLKAREETKSSSSSPSMRVSGSGQLKTGLATKTDKEGFPDRPLTPGSSHGVQNSSKHQLKAMHHSQERSGVMYQPLVGSGGAFKPYEYSSNSSSPAPPAHQNTSPAIASRIPPSQYQQIQDQPQNLVKGDSKNVQEKVAVSQKYDSRDIKLSASASNCLPARISPPFTNSTSPASNTYSYSLIQQGLVPNPMYIAATHSGSSTNSTPPVPFIHSQSSKLSVGSGSPPVSQQFPHANPNSGITSGSPVCRPSSVPYSLPQGRMVRSYSPVGSMNTPANVAGCKTNASDTQNSARNHMSVQNSSHRSLSPAHLYGTQSQPSAPNSPHQSSPRMPVMSNHPSVHLPGVNASLPFYPNSPSDISDSAGIPLVKRKLISEVTSRKRPKSIDDGLLPPQLQPQVHASSMNSGENLVTAPPHLSSNAPVLAEHQDAFSTVKSNPPSPITTSSLAYKSEPEVSLPSMPDLQHTTPMDQMETHSDTEQSPETQNYFSGLAKFKIQSKNLNSASAEESECSTSSQVINTFEKTPTIKSEESEDQLSNNSTIANINSSSTTNSNFHPKLKKAWLQRHSENEVKKSPENACEPEDEALNNVKSEPSEAFPGFKPEPYVLIDHSICNKYLEEGKVKASSDFEIPSENKSIKLETDENSSCSESDGESIKNGKRKNKSKASSPKKEKDSKKKDSRKRGRKNKGRNIIHDSKKKAAKTVEVIKPEKPSLAQLKKTGEAFLQDGACHEVAPRLPKCRECRLTPHQRSKKMPNIFCRFYAYRKLRYGKNGTILSAGFSDIADALEEDFKLWMPPINRRAEDLEIENSKFLLTHVGDQFCELVELEREAQKLHMSNDTTITWKRVVQGVREMCDVCETTLFNIHWVCHKCGFVVCIDCYKSRKNGLHKEELSLKDRDDYQWLLCNNRQPHEQDKLMMTQIIAGSSLWDVGKILHTVRQKWNIPTYCNCKVLERLEESKSSANGICKLMNAVTKCFTSSKDMHYEDNGSSDIQHVNKSSNKSSANGLANQEEAVGGYSSESGGSPLSWLADVALNSSVKSSEEQKDKDDDEKSSEDQDSNADAGGESDDDKNENFSTLRELLIRPTGKMGGKGSSSGSQKTLHSTLDEVISCVIEQKVRKSDKKNNEKQLLHFTRRYQMSKTGRDIPPVRTCLLAESSLLYPDIPHVWLGSGKILLLKDPYHSGNMQLFQEQWKRGQPIIVADVGKHLDPNLWTPESFINEFGDSKIDLLNCLGGAALHNQPMKKFWEGFDNISKRLRNEDGELLVLRMSDWPLPDEFSDTLPTRYDDLMKVLPLPQYTRRDGIYNMTSHLPDWFVQPDLGPRMYNAYGISSSLGKGSSNLHLEVSDAVNLMVYVASLDDDKDEQSYELVKAIEDSGCDILMKNRSLQRGSKPGAIWHIYNARDADKIRDFLNKVSQEQGVKLNPHHDPIHNQTWYLDVILRNRLQLEYGVEAYTIVQCMGDAIFIPAGSPHQLLNISNCIKVSEDFVSPESAGQSFFLTREIRNLSDSIVFSDDRLQIKNIIYHTVKDALSLLQLNQPGSTKSWKCSYKNKE